MKIVIAGAGIGGLTAALSLDAVGLHDVRVLEAVPEIRPLGAGVNLQPNAVRELAALGLAENLAELGAELTGLGYYNHLGQEIWRESRGRASDSRWPQLGLHRGMLQKVLADTVRARLGDTAITTDARVTGFAPLPGGGVEVTVGHRAGDRSADRILADVLIGADGLRSAVRRSLYPREGEPRSHGTAVWRGVTRGAPFHGGRSMVVMGDGHWKAVVYPLAVRPDADGLVPVNWAVSRAGPERDVPPGPADDGFLDAVSHWRCGDLRLDALVTGTGTGTGAVPSFPLLDRDPVPRWSFGATTLLGDAAHAMAPMGSNATTQAVLDARSLAHALATHEHPVAALAAYDRDRRPRMNRLQLLNRAKGPEVVIDLVHERAPEGFGRVEDVIPAARLAEVAHTYARAAGFDAASVNAPSPYGRPLRSHLPHTTVHGRTPHGR
ncbi:FAD-dependent monooxygenase [Streptomyces capillispiralis]|uniref:Prepilin-type processing-associated H-X9-DG protein n=1 Tax=Streptomyces capillispiralis TaxID=68182 RepID=A0A561TL97_9ACTN|nr:FAD-dependent monooxygenase [Streptomyces capillispiralis]TWF87898.1 prepilin-type processing-associated H-X9-DG protein [Streptomyces capillispiralis]GHH95011.1 flavin-dependent oxidoreductase [Streptomyces capillispiralis]